jgi:hypothetical protein
MALDRIQLFAPPGGPGVVGGVKAGTGVTIAPDGTLGASNTGVTSVIAGTGVTVNQTTGNVTIGAVGGGGGTPFAAGTTITVFSAAAPTGYTKDTGFNNTALRVVAGTGGGFNGSVPFTTVFGSQTPTGSVNTGGGSISGNTNNSDWSPSATISQGGCALLDNTTTAQQSPAHQHNYDIANDGGGTFSLASTGGNIILSTTFTVTNDGGSQGHTHSFSFSTNWQLGNFSHNHSFSGTSNGGSSALTANAINLQVKYKDAIICIKN